MNYNNSLYSFCVVSVFELKQRFMSGCSKYLLLLYNMTLIRGYMSTKSDNYKLVYVSVQVYEGKQVHTHMQVYINYMRYSPGVNSTHISIDVFYIYCCVGVNELSCQNSFCLIFEFLTRHEFISTSKEIGYLVQAMIEYQLIVLNLGIVIFSNTINNKRFTFVALQKPDCEVVLSMMLVINIHNVAL